MNARWRPGTFASLMLVSLAPVLAGAAPAGGARFPCTTATLTLRVESGGGRFTGMSHDGAVVVVRNVGTTACELPVLPQLTMRDDGGRVVARGVPRGARFLHPGPVAFPLELDPGEIAATTIRWIDADVFGTPPARHVLATSLALTLGRDALTTPLSASVWGHSEPTFAQERFTTALPPLGPLSQAAAGTFVGEGPAGATYVYGRNVPARQFMVEHAPGDALRFVFQGVAGTAPSTGTIQGSLDVRDGRAVFDDPANDCHLTLTFYDPQLVVTQRGTCGFGNGVTAAGQYRQT